MNNFKVINTGFMGLKIIETKVFEDERGFFLESYNQRAFREIGIFDEFIQDNHSMSSKDVLRGLHFQLNKPQGKLVRVISGKVLDFVVDIRMNSETFLKLFSIVLEANDNKMLMIPEGFAHGFLSLEDKSQVQYKCTNLYDSSDEYTLHISEIFNELPIDNPLDRYLISEKDKKGITVNELRDLLIEKEE